MQPLQFPHLVNQQGLHQSGRALISTAGQTISPGPGNMPDPPILDHGMPPQSPAIIPEIHQHRRIQTDAHNAACQAVGVQPE
jgi:hypothetical protein